MTMKRARGPGVVVGIMTMLIPAALGAQTVSGLIANQDSQVPVSGVVVTLLDSAGTTVVIATTADDGRYRVGGSAAGWYRLRFQVPGYQMLVTPLLELSVGQELDYPLALTPVPPTLLDTLLVEGRPVPWNMVGFYNRRKVGVGYFATRDEWDHWAVLNISDVIRRLNPFGISGRASCAGWPIFLDGMPMPTGFDTGTLFLDHFEAIEVHRIPTVPPEFDRPFGACGATVLWSRLDLTGRTAHLDLGVHAGTALAGAQGGRGRVGMEAALGLGGVIELYVALSGIVSTVDPGSVVHRSGWEILGALRVRPLGQERGWYVGLGGRAGGLRETGSQASTEEQDFVALSGWQFPMGRVRPFVELQLLGLESPGSAVLTGLVGVSARIY